MDDPSFRAQAGFNRNHGSHFYALPGSGTSDILLLTNTSYVNISGVWIFRVDDDDVISIGGIHAFLSVITVHYDNVC